MLLLLLLLLLHDGPNPTGETHFNFHRVNNRRTELEITTSSNAPSSSILQGQFSLSLSAQTEMENRSPAHLQQIFLLPNFHLLHSMPIIFTFGFPFIFFVCHLAPPLSNFWAVFLLFHRRKIRFPECDYLLFSTVIFHEDKRWLIVTKSKRKSILSLHIYLKH